MLLTSALISLHILAAVIWVGGMVFAYVCLRPVAATQLEPPQRLRLWVGVFTKFFPLVWLSVILLPLTGYTLLFTIWHSMAAAPVYIHLMNGLGTVMILLYLHLYFAPFKRLKRAVNAEAWPEGAAALSQMRQLIAVNMTLGLLVVLIASAGRYLT